MGRSGDAHGGYNSPQIQRKFLIPLAESVRLVYEYLTLLVFGGSKRPYIYRRF